ncbi:MAG: bifunctional hydroxymethylpyrimidine kinase/phosphomethylpyrimidine kinase [Deltaproteobacteria bacterium]|nr:bifunctional hydroxymethylpyrimidine kinase/phosphomethylpyrimidine kinase [Deltaproteobacteria bacterium]
MKIARILTIAGSDSGGGAGIQADIKTITALGGFGMTVLTALTAQNTLGVQGIHELPVDFVMQQFDSVASDIGVDAAKTGMLSNSRIIRAVAVKVKEFGIEKLVVDPVMVAKGGAMLIREEAKRTLTEILLPLAFIVTPNIPEAEAITDRSIITLGDMEEAARRIATLGPRCVYVKGGHREDDPVDVLYDGKNIHHFRSARIHTEDTHGTGCTLSAAIAAGLGQGLSVYDAVARAKDYITTAIRFSLRIGGGHGPTNHMAHVFRESARYECIVELKSAVEKLLRRKIGNVIPEVQSNFGFALPFATGLDEVAAVPGRIVRVGERGRTLADPDFGVSSHVARIILTVIKYDDDCRSAMDIRFSEEIVDICRKLGYAVAEFSRSEEPPDVKAREGSSIEWGTNLVLSHSAAVPDVVFDRGDIGKEAIVRIIGRRPADVADKALAVSAALSKSRMKDLQ